MGILKATHVLDSRFHGNDRIGRVYVIPDLTRLGEASGVAWVGNPVFLLPPFGA